MANPHKLPLPKWFFKTIDKVKRVDDKGMLYYLEYNSNYYLLEKFVNLLAKPACSTFLSKNEKGDYIFSRNYDFVHYKNNDRKSDMTALNIVVNSKSIFAKYRSLSVCDGFWLDFGKGRLFEGTLDDGVTDISALALIPFLAMDGINEKGLAVSIMHLPTENEWTETEYTPFDSLDEEKKRISFKSDIIGETPKRLDYKVKTGALFINEADKKCWIVNKNFAVSQNKPHQKKMFHPVLMRRMLDYCKDCDSAIKLAAKTNVVSPLRDSDYHIMISDKSGKSAILEWVDNKMNVKYINHGTNFYLTRDDRYGYGEDRDEIISKELEKSNGIINEKDAMKLLDSLSQDFRVNKFGGFTLWSSVYNLNDLTLTLTQNMEYDKEYTFSLRRK